MARWAKMVVSFNDSFIKSGRLRHAAAGTQLLERRIEVFLQGLAALVLMGWSLRVHSFLGSHWAAQAISRWPAATVPVNLAL